MPAVKPTFPVINRSSALAQGILGAWPCYEGSGNSLDEVNLSYNGILTTPPAWSNDQCGTVLKFTRASSQYATLTNSSIVNIYKPASSTKQGVSVSIWCKPASSPTGQMELINDWTNAFAQGWAIYRYQDNVFYIASNGGDAVYTSAYSTLNVWYHLVWVWNGVNNIIYVNGKNDTHNSVQFATAPVPRATQPLYMGARDLGGVTNFFDGMLDTPIMFNRALSASEVSFLYAFPFAPFEPDLTPLLHLSSFSPAWALQANIGTGF